MRGRIIAEILVYRGVRHEIRVAPFHVSRDFLMKETHEKGEGLCIFG
jgi:hypothetical protein